MGESPMQESGNGDGVHLVRFQLPFSQTTLLSEMTNTGYLESCSVNCTKYKNSCIAVKYIVQSIFFSEMLKDKYAFSMHTKSDTIPISDNIVDE